MIRVLAVASEIYPLLKTGGLGDVVGALPLALMRAGPAGTASSVASSAKPSAPVAAASVMADAPTFKTNPAVDVTTMIPGYPAVLAALTDAIAVHQFADLFGGPATVLRANAASLELLVLDAPHLYARAGSPYLGADGREWADNGMRFAALGAAAAAIGRGVVPGLTFDIVHAHDWQAAMAVVYLHFHNGPRPGTVITIHNMAFQGRYPAALFPRLGLPASAFSLNGLEFHGDVNFLKGGLSYADRITTVSPGYAREITGVEHGMGLDGVLRHHSGILTGILNGIDDTVWNPATDLLLPARYSRGKMGKRADNKLALQQQMGLEENPDALLIGVISRLTSQKGLDMLLDRLDTLAGDGLQLALLGSGEPELEQAFVAAAEWHLGSVGCVIGYDETVAHLIQAGSDALLVPSRFEPCGLTQLYALRYGSVPVVSRVGGLADSVIDANEAALAAGVATGIQLWPATPEALQIALDRLQTLWRDKPAWAQVQRNGMAADVSWRRPAAQYVALYRSLLVAHS